MQAATSSGQDTEKAIWKAAVKVIAKHGFKAASLREIAKKVGIRAPSLYNYIQSKEKLLFQLLKAPLTAMIADYSAHISKIDDPVERLHIFMQVHQNFHLHSRLEVFIGNMELRSLTTPHYRAITDLRDDYSMLLTKIIDDGVKAGVFKVSEPRVTTLVMLGMLSSVCNWFHPDGAMSAVKITELTTEMAFRMLGADEPVPIGKRVRKKAAA
ncbi:MAG: TetR/AcrR family transcriptional regulator [Devosia sp.]